MAAYLPQLVQFARGWQRGGTEGGRLGKTELRTSFVKVLSACPCMPVDLDPPGLRN